MIIDVKKKKVGKGCVPLGYNGLCISTVYRMVFV